MGKIKVSAPASNPHICYISPEYKEIISVAKKITGNSLYKILCAAAGKNLNTPSRISSFKSEVKQRGFRNIGEWAEHLLSQVSIDHSTIRI